eukprot:TRINITY_DN2808_c0_g1_i6.p1 TRINITY_DN2808_c0_g1~~TRINITY_DN2808_c0_g1_i6.p1  ORF type:complete len:133 (+),score=14.08 TRINITY_DN2808_c0_g1_i6:510-908(+)
MLSHVKRSQNDGFNAFGTVREDRAGIPKNPETKGSETGRKAEDERPCSRESKVLPEVNWRERHSLCFWKDCKAAEVLSTLPGASKETRTCRGTTGRGNDEKVQTFIDPPHFGMYNQIMGGIDLFGSVPKQNR